MTYLVIKYALSAAIVVALSEISKRSSLLGGVIASLPLVSLLGIIWLYHDTRDTARITALCTSIVWFVQPSLVLFVLLAVLLKRHVLFYPALAASLAAMLACYGIMALGLNKFGVKL